MVESVDKSVGRIVQRLEEAGVAGRHARRLYVRQRRAAKDLHRRRRSRRTPTRRCGMKKVRSTKAEFACRSLCAGRARPRRAKRAARRRRPSTCFRPSPTRPAQWNSPVRRAMENLSSPLLGNPKNGPPRDNVFFHYPHYHHSRPAGAVRSGDWKLIEFFDDQSVELYNLKRDLGETTNVAAAHPEIADELLKSLRTWRASVGAKMPTPNPNFDPNRADEWWNRKQDKPIDREAAARGTTRAPPARRFANTLFIKTRRTSSSSSPTIRRGTTSVSWAARTSRRRDSTGSLGRVLSFRAVTSRRVFVVRRLQR